MYKEKEKLEFFLIYFSEDVNKILGTLNIYFLIKINIPYYEYNLICNTIVLALPFQNLILFCEFLNKANNVLVLRLCGFFSKDG